MFRKEVKWYMNYFPNTDHEYKKALIFGLIDRATALSFKSSHKDNIKELKQFSNAIKTNADAQTADSGTSPGQMLTQNADGQHADGQNADGQNADGQNSTRQNADGETLTCKTPTVKTPTVKTTTLQRQPKTTVEQQESK